MVGVQAQLTEKPLTKFFTKSNIFNRSGTMFLFQRNCIFLWEPIKLDICQEWGSGPPEALVDLHSLASVIAACIHKECTGM